MQNIGGAALMRCQRAYSERVCSGHYTHTHARSHTHTRCTIRLLHKMSLPCTQWHTLCVLTSAVNIASDRNHTRRACRPCAFECDQSNGYTQRLSIAHSTHTHLPLFGKAFDTMLTHEGPIASVRSNVHGQYATHSRSQMAHTQTELTPTL